MSIFTQVQNTKPPTNTFNLTHDKKLSGKIGNLIPILNLECLPGDVMTLKSSAMVRFAPLIAPLMHRVNVYIHYFFIPNRIIWPAENENNGWEKFITGGEDGLDDTVWANGLYNPNSYTTGSLPDYLGLPIESDVLFGGRSVRVNPLPAAGYQKVYNDFYRDQNLVEAEIDYVTDGNQDALDFETLNTLRRRAWQHDYFTSALPWTQKGPEAMLPLGTQAPVRAFNDENQSGVNQQAFRDITDPSVTWDGNMETTGGEMVVDNGAVHVSYVDLQDSHYADLSDATASSINDLRRAFKLQEWLEKNARGGSRYNESIQVHFGVTSSDKRLQRPEYIGGLKTPVQISEVLQTSNNDTQETPQGNMAGHGISVGSGESFSYRCEEHGYITGIMSIMPESSYQQGIPKHFNRQDKFDYYWPEFAHIGEQPIMNTEIVVTDDTEHDDQVFGYTPRYADYKYMPNTVHGDFKSTLDFWHMSRKFGDYVFLNRDFIECDPDEVKRVFAVQDKSDNMWCQIINNVKARRPMPVFGTPKIN